MQPFFICVIFQLEYQALKKKDLLEIIMKLVFFIFSLCFLLSLLKELGLSLNYI